MTKFYVLEGRDAKPHGDDAVAWAKAWRGPNHVDDTMIGSVRVSTVFLGVDHQYGDGPPLIFETMIFGGVHDQEQWRCSTWTEAEAQHEAACALVRSALN